MALLNQNKTIAQGDKYTVSGLGFSIHHGADSLSGVVEQAGRCSIGSTIGILQRIGCGFLVLDRNKRVLEWNKAARDTLERQGEVADTASALAAALRRLVADVPGHFRTGSLSWVVIRDSGDRPVILTEDDIVAPEGTCIVVLLDRKSQTPTNPQTLQKMFGLTGAETHLALRLARGDAPLDIARTCHLSRTTIRTHLASLFAKTNTRRQGELVALLGRIALLP